MSVRVVLVDDQVLIRMGLRMILEAEPDIEVVGEGANGWEAITLVRELVPDVVVTDVRMPDLDGITATAQILAGPNPPHVLVLTTFDLDEYVFAAINAGASGFLLKDAPPDELVSAIRAVAQGDAVLSPRVTREVLKMVRSQDAPGPEHGALHPEALGAGAGSGLDADADAGSDLDSEDAAASDEPCEGLPAAPRALDTLTRREREILAAVAAGFNNAELGRQFYISESTIKTHIGNLFQKLGVRDRVHLVIWAYRHGIVGEDLVDTLGDDGTL